MEYFQIKKFARFYPWVAKKNRQILVLKKKKLSFKFVFHNLARASYGFDQALQAHHKIEIKKITDSKPTAAQQLRVQSLLCHQFTVRKTAAKQVVGVSSASSSPPCICAWKLTRGFDDCCHIIHSVMK